MLNSEGKYGTVLTSRSTRLTLLRDLLWDILSAENQDGYEIPRYSKPNHARFYKGWIRLPIQEYTTEASVTHATTPKYHNTKIALDVGRYK